VYVCIESFGSDHELGGCAEGTRLRGNSPKVQRWPHFFASDGLDDVEIHRARRRLYEPAGKEGDAP